MSRLSPKIILSLAAALSLALSLTLMQPAAFAASATSLYYKGSAYTNYLAGTNMGISTGVMSASAYYDTSNATGVERIRAWSRLQNIEQLYPPGQGYTDWVQAQNFQLNGSNNTNADLLYITGVNPPDTTSSTTIQEVLYQILNYVPYAPTDTIEAYVNSFTVSGISTQGLGSYDVQRTFNGSGSSSIDLPPSISYSDVDGAVDSQVSSAQSYFFYNWDPNTALNLYPEAEIEYGFSYQGSFPWFYWTNYAGFQHSVNAG